MHRRAAILSIFLCTLAYTPAFAQEAPSLFRDDAQGFAISFPVEPQAGIMRDPAPNLSDVVEVFRAEAWYDDSNFNVMVYTFQNAELPRRALRDGAMQRSLPEGARLISERRIRARGLEGRERISEQMHGVGISIERFFVSGARLSACGAQSNRTRTPRGRGALP